MSESPIGSLRCPPGERYIYRDFGALGISARGLQRPGHQRPRTPASWASAPEGSSVLGISALMEPSRSGPHTDGARIRGLIHTFTEVAEVNEVGLTE